MVWATYAGGWWLWMKVNGKETRKERDMLLSDVMRETRQQADMGPGRHRSLIDLAAWYGWWLVILGTSVVRGLSRQQ